VVSKVLFVLVYLCLGVYSTLIRDEYSGVQVRGETHFF
jgi:hypothetical protein